MRNPGNLLFLFLILELIPQPGVSQGRNHWKYCQDCGRFLKDSAMNDRFYQYLVQNATYEECPHNIARFVLPRGIFCGERGESWVENVIRCINQGRLPCLKSSENQQDFPKGSYNKLPSTTQETTTSTTKAAPFPGQSMQTLEGGTQKEPSHQNNGVQQGVSQGINNWKYCQDCRIFLKDADINERFYQNLVENARYEACPNNVARFVLPRGIFCGERGESGVENIIGCINQGRLPCLKSSENQQDFPKGSDNKLPSTTQETTTSTTKAAPFPGQSMQTLEGGTQKEPSHQNNGVRQGVSQGINNWKYCQDCRRFLKDADMNERFYQNLVENARYEACPNNVARFVLPRGIFCGERGESWVENVIRKTSL
ncbi:uncharacterized protein LOC143774322 isoform X2 [Ranitomeya variabilis]|uniref:uncharacterized protein LOC143774322 isoform X2 n=1 Tax=Ranitomeya variabilis TaxID=490064 RepID=UPI0040566EF7